MILRLILLGAPALASGVSCAFADEARVLDPVEVTGLRPVEADRATVSLTVLTGEDLAVRLSPNPADQLRAVPGAAVSRSGSLGGLTQVRFRGAEANHTLVLFEGIEVSDPVNGDTDFGLLTVLPVGRIDVLRGASSSVYGSDAIGGVVSVSPARGAGLTGFAEGGSFGSLNGALGWQGEKVGAVLSGLATDGVDTSGTGGQADGSEALSGLALAAFDLTPGWSLSLIGLARRAGSDFDSDSDFDGLLNDTDERTEARQRLVGAALSGAGGPIDHVLRASYNQVDRENFSGGALTDTATGARTKLSWSPGYRRGGHRLTGLVDFERETYHRQDSRFGGLTNASEAFDALAIAAEYALAAGPFDLAASVRHDDNAGRFDDASTWRIGAGYALAGTGGRLRASVGTGVKNPTFTELFGFFPGSFTGNPDLKPEAAESWEIGWEQTLGRFGYSATYFESNLKNEIFTAFNPDFTSAPRNRAGTSERSGVELAGRWQAGANLVISGQASFFNSQDDTGADEIRVPERTVSLAADWLLREDGLRAGLAVDHVGEQGDFDFGPFPARRAVLDAYSLVSLTAEYPLTDLIAVTLRGSNLLDETAIDVFGYNGPGAGVFVGLKIR